MKKIVYSFLLCGFVFGVYAQDAADRKVQAGLVFGTGVNFQKMNTRNFEKEGVTANMMVGAIVNIGFTNSIGLSLGAEFDFDNMKYTPKSPTYYDFNDTKILRSSESTVTSKTYSLAERKQQAIYLTVPTMLLFRTNYIGYFRYFGKFGLRSSFLLSAKSNDKGFTIDPLSVPPIVEEDNPNMKLESGNDMVFYRGSVGLSAGAEWNFISSTCIALEVGYYYGFTPLYYNPKEDKRTLYQINDGKRDYINNAVNQSQLLFKISILF
jgi:hypothetical protein